MVALSHGRSGAHIRFLAVSEDGFQGHRTGLKLMFFDISLLKLFPLPHTYGYFLFNENIHSCRSSTEPCFCNYKWHKICNFRRNASDHNEFNDR